MGKLADPHRLRCVHCHSTETPLWRTGPDGPKTLCNACGVRFKKGKLILFKDSNGNLTAVKQDDAVPVHIPPPCKKSTKKSITPSPPQSPSPLDVPIKRVVRKVPSEGTISAAAVGKKPRYRSRRTTAGQLPGRYVSKHISDPHWRSPTSSPKSSPSSPQFSPNFNGKKPARFSLSAAPPIQGSRSTDWVERSLHNSRPDSSFGLFASSASLSMDDMFSVASPSRAEEDKLFSDLASLGLDCSADPDNNTLLPMPADPSSAEQFSFAFSTLGRDACLAADTPDRVGALRALLLDRTRKVSAIYDTTVRALCRLYSHRNGPPNSTSSTAVNDSKTFVHAFAQEHTGGLNLDFCPDLPPSHSLCCVTTSAPMLSDQALLCAAVESFRTLMDSTDLVGFAEACLIELLAEDVLTFLSQTRLPENDLPITGCIVDPRLPQTKPISTSA